MVPALAGGPPIERLGGQARAVEARRHARVEPELAAVRGLLPVPPEHAQDV